MSGPPGDKGHTGRPAVASSRSRFDPFAVVSLQEVRRLIRTSKFRGAVVLFGLLYVIGALFEGGMVVFANFGGGYTTQILLSSPLGIAWWNYPGLFVVAPWGVVQLPFFATFTMVVVGAGVGLSMTVALILALRLFRPSPGERARDKAVGAATGLTPAMVGLVTLGACCTSTTAATAGIGLVATASATSVANLLVNNWFLGVFQIAIVAVSLVAQELLLTVYRGLFGSADARIASPAAAPVSLRRWAAAGALRLALLAGGLLWSLDMFAEWTTTDPTHAPAAAWFAWIVQHQLLGLTAMAIALFPAGALGWLARARSGVRALLPALLLVGGASLFLWYPLSLAGLEGLPGEVLGATGFGPVWAGIGPGSLPWSAELFRWSLEFLLVGAVSLVAAVRPGRLRVALDGTGAVSVARTGPLGASAETGTGRPASDVEGS